MRASPGTWTDQDGAPIGCREKLRVLDENQAEVAQVMRDAFEDAVLIGVDPQVMRDRLHHLVDHLRDPRRR